MKKTLSAVLCAVLLLTGSIGCFTGCQNAPEGNPNGSTAATMATEGTDPEEATADDTADETADETAGETAAVTEPDAETEAETDPEEETEPETEGAQTPAPAPTVEAFPQKAVMVGNRRVASIAIIADESASSRYAGSQLQKYLEKVGVTVSETGEYAIYIRRDETLAPDSYHLQIGETFEEGMTIRGNGRGTILAVFDFLEEYVSLRFFTPSLEACLKSSMIRLKTGETIEYTPVFEYRFTEWEYNYGTDYTAKTGMNHGFSIEWDSGYGYANFVHTLGALTNTPSTEQPCLTDPEILAMAIANVRKLLEENPHANIVSVSQNDNSNFCRCANCAAITAEEGSQAGPLLRFVNAVAADIAEDYPNVIVDTLAYWETQKPPAVTKPLPNVCIRLCTIACCFTHPLTENCCEENIAFRRDLEGWSEICERIYIWNYETNFPLFLSMFPNFHAMRENMRFFAEHNVKGIFAQGSYQPHGEFAELRRYLITELLKDPMMGEMEYFARMDEFLQAYYGDGWKYIRMYIDSMCLYSPCVTCYTILSQREMNSAYGHMMGYYEEWWDQAEELAGNCLANVQKSRLSFRFTQLMMTPDAEKGQKLVDDVIAANVFWREGMAPTALPEGYDLSQPSDTWIHVNRRKASKN